MSRPSKDWLITCRDGCNRRRKVIVFADGSHVVMIAPAGETTVLAPLEVGRLRAALGNAVRLAAPGAGS